MEQSEQQLRKNVQFFLDWMKEHRPHIAGLGAPIQMLKNMLDGEDVAANNVLWSMQREERLNKEIEVIDFENEGPDAMKNYLNNF